MKKFYTLALAAAVAVSASAATKVASVQKTMPFNGEFQAVEAVETAAPAKAPAKAISTINDLVGIYDGRYTSGFYNGWQQGIYSVRISGDNKVKILGFGVGYEVEGTVNITRKTITFPGNQQVGAYDDGTPVYCRHFRWSDDGKSISAVPNQDIVYNFNDAGVITYNDGKDIFFLGTDESLAESSGVGCNYRVTLTPKPDDSADWTSVGSATFTDDGWVNPLYLYPASNYQMTATAQRNNTNPNRIRIIGQYQNWNADYAGGQEINLASAMSGAIVFDVTTPGCVLVEMGNFCGFQDADEGMYYAYNLEGKTIAEGEGEITATDLIEVLGAEECSNYDEVNQVLNIKNCLFGFTGQESRGQSWNEWLKPEYQCTETATVVLPENMSKITDIILDQAAPARYFNLQGMEVANPTHGLYIRVQGKKAEKVIL